MSDKDTQESVSLADLLRRTTPGQSAAKAPPPQADPPRPRAAAEVVAEAEPEAEPEPEPELEEAPPHRLEVEVVDLEPDAEPAAVEEEVTAAPDMAEPVGETEPVAEEVAPEAPDAASDPVDVAGTEASPAAEEAEAPAIAEEDQAQPVAEETEVPAAAEDAEAPAIAEETEVPAAAEETEAPAIAEEAEASPVAEEAEAPAAAEEAETAAIAEEAEVPAPAEEAETEAPAIAEESEALVAAAALAAKHPPLIKPRVPFADRKPGWLAESAGVKSPVSAETAHEAFTKALAGDEPEEEEPVEETPAVVDKPVIDISRLELTFITNDGPVEALADINLKVGRGEFVSLIGPSGCGKTTLLRVIADLERATSGTVLVNGVTPEQARQSRAYGYVFQAPALYPWRTIAKNVALPLEIMGLGVIEREGRIARNLELVNLTGFEKKYPWQLSGGMQQRASIARALAVEPDLLLMDEPFGALDEIVRDHLNQQLLELWAQTNKTVVFVTHSIPEAVFLSTRIVVMTPRPGKIHDIIESTLPRDRNLDIRETPEFLRIAHRVRLGLRAGHSYDD